MPEGQIKLVRRLIQAQDDPGKQRIRAWLRELDDEQLSSIGLTPEGHSRPAPLNFGTLRKPVATELTMLERNHSVPLSSFVQAERLARVERGSVIKACVRGTMRRFAEWLRVLGVLSIRLARDLAAKRVLRRAIRELHQLDDRMLADIGISRGEIEPAVRNGLPTRVTHTGASHHARHLIRGPRFVSEHTLSAGKRRLRLFRQSGSTNPGPGHVNA
jgi:uncharacterized protein YjiS (DUF1127 family)